MNKNVPLSGGFGNKKSFPRTRFDSLDDTFQYPGNEGKVVTVRGDGLGLTAQDEAIIDEYKVKVSGTDTTPNYLINKLEALIEEYQGGLTLTNQDPAGNSVLKIGINAIHPHIGLDGELNAPMVNAESLSEVEIAPEWKDGEPYVKCLRSLGTQTNQAAAGSDSRFTKVRISSADTTPGYLDDKIETAGLISITATGLTQTIQDPASNEKLQLAINAVHESIGLDLILNAPMVNPQSLDSSYVKSANIDGTAATPSMRTLGTLSSQAAAGNDSRLSDARTPTAHRTTHLQSGSDAFALNGTGSAPSASGLPNGTLFFKYTA